MMKEHADKMRLIRAAIPRGISLVGSDYLSAPPAKPGLAQLAERMSAGRNAANEAARYLRARS